MRHRAFNVLSALSLLLCTGLLIGWIRSYSVSNVIGYIGAWHIQGQEAVASEYLFLHHHGTIVLALGSRFDTDADNIAQGQAYPSSGWNYATAFAHPKGLWHFEYRHVTRSYKNQKVQGREFAFPYWCPSLLAAVVPAIWLVSFRRRQAKQRERLGLCPACGYDLRATPDRCPECGTPALTGGPTAPRNDNDIRGGTLSRRLRP